MAAAGEEQDVYLCQLKEVFDSCDEEQTGKLGRNQLILLCQKLQLEEFTDTVITQLLGDGPDTQISFNKFKDDFVKLLCQIMTDHDGSTASRSNTPSPVVSLDEAFDMSPKLVWRSKRYGRRTKPLVLGDLASSSDMETDKSITQDSTQDEDSEEPAKKKSKESSRATSEDEKDTFEAEGQLNLALAAHEDMSQFDTEEDELRAIWEKLDVGKNGYLTITELAEVCYHIGLDQMDEDELQQLFEKLDVDRDGKVGFQEFCQGLFQHTPPASVCMTPRSISTPTPRSLSAQKKLKFISTPNSEERTTPSIVVGSGTSGLFSSIDGASSGFAKPEEISDLWETYNVSQGTEILQALGFDNKSKVNLSELSFVLEQELMNLDDQGTVHQVALATFKQEIRHLKSTVEQMSWAQDKLKLDLSESNSRNSMLAKEVDEQHEKLEQMATNKLLSLEKQYQEQIKILQTELEQEKENVTARDSQFKQLLEVQMEDVRNDTACLREKLLQTQKELENLECEYSEQTKKLQDAKKQNDLLEDKLKSAAEIERKLAEYEAKGALLSPDEQMFARSKLESMEQQNKELKDKNDELTAEVEGLKQITRRRSVPSQKSIPEQTKIPIREGTPLSEYLRKNMKRRATVSSLDLSDDDASSTGSVSRRRRFLPETPDDDTCSVSSVQSDKDQAEQLRQELNEFKNNFERERKEIEHAYKVEIAGIEDKHDQEKAEMLKVFEMEKTKLEEDWERRKQNLTAELQRELQTKFVHEKQDIIQKCESEKNLMNQNFSDEKQKMLERLNKEYTVDLEKQVEQVKDKYEQELEMLKIALREADPTLREQEIQIADLEKVVESQNEKLKKNQKLDSKLQDSMKVIEELQNENSDLKLSLDHERKDWDQVFEQEKEDFTEKIDLYEFTIAQYESSLENAQHQKNELETQIESQRIELESAIQENDKLAAIIEKGNEDIREKQTVIEEMAKQRDELKLLLEQEREKWNESLEKTLTEYSFALNDLGQQNAELETKLKRKSESDEGKSEIEFLKIEHAREIAEYKEKLLEKKSSDVNVMKQEDVDMLMEEKEEAFEKERTVLCRGFKQKITALEEKNQIIIEDYEKKLEEVKVKNTQNKTAGDKASKECEESIARVVREELEEEFVNQVEQLKESFEDERKTLAEEISLLREQVQMYEEALELERANQTVVTELRTQVADLQNDKHHVEKTNAELHSTLQTMKQNLEGRIDELMSEKSNTIVPIHVQRVSTAIHTKTDEKPAYEEVVKEKNELETKVKQLELKVSELDSQTGVSSELSLQVKEANDLKTSLQTKDKVIKDLQSDLQSKSKEVDSLKTDLESKSREFTDMRTVLETESEKVKKLQATLQDKLEEVKDLQKKHDMTLEDNIKVHSATKDDLKTSYDALLKEKSFLQSDLSNLKEELVRLETVAKRADSLQIMNDNLHCDNDNYLEKIHSLEMGLAEKEVAIKEQKDDLEKVKAEKEKLQHTLNRSEDRMKNTDRKIKEYQQMEMEFNQVKKEKDNMSFLVETLQQDVQSSSAVEEELLREKEKVKTCQQEKQTLEKELKVASDKFEKLSQNLLSNKLDHDQELRNLKEQTDNRIELGKYVQLQMDLLDQQKELQDMQSSLEFKDLEYNKEIYSMEEAKKKLSDSLEEDKQDLARKLKLLQNVLDEQVDKLRQQYIENEKRSHLVVNLYKENAELMDSLYKMERKKKDAISRCYKLEDQCVLLRRTLKKVCHVVIN